MADKANKMALTYLAVGLVIGILFMCYGGYQVLCNRQRKMAMYRYYRPEYMGDADRFGLDMRSENRGFTGSHNIGGMVYIPPSNSQHPAEFYSNFNPNFIVSENMSKTDLPGANMNSIFIDPNNDNGPEDIVRMDNFTAYGKEVAKPQAATPMNRFWPEQYADSAYGKMIAEEGYANTDKLYTEEFAPPQHKVVGDKYEGMADLNSSWDKIVYTDKNIEGVPDVVATYAGAYQKAYNLVGTTTSGNLVYEFYGLSKDAARAKWDKAFPGYEYPKSLQ